MTRVLIKELRIPHPDDEPETSVPVWVEGQLRSIGRLQLIAGKDVIWVGWSMKSNDQATTYLSQALEAVFPILLQHYHRIQVDLRSEDTIAQNIVRDLGMRYEGTARRARWNNAAKAWDSIEIWAMLQEDLDMLMGKI